MIKKIVSFFKDTGLSLSRKASQKIMLVRDDEVIEIKIIRVKPESVKMGISSNKELIVTKEEDINPA